ncbi:subunits of heterodimeric actin filament capping protein Capz [Atractiella rhizophila]|nr:subunits of heterodimeric actin filament capping protein Capz [Atractiella rhizophila]
MDQKSRLEIAANFIHQAPPGEVNDVFNDIRTIIADDVALETGLTPALRKYNLDQHVIIDLPSLKKQALLCDAALVPGQEEGDWFYDPASGNRFKFDHVRLIPEEVKDEPIAGEHEDIRKGLEKAWTAYVSEHYHEGIVGVYSRFTIETKDVEVEEEVEVDVEVEVPVEVEAPPPATPMSTADGDEEEGKDKEAVEGEGEGTEDAMTTPAPPQVEMRKEIRKEKRIEKRVERREELQSLPKFSVRSVGNRYNFSNYWSGRWRSSWEIDLSTSTLTGSILVNVHYFEQGNVQLTTSFNKSLCFSASASSPSFSTQILKEVHKIETSYQTTLNEVYSDLAERNFKGLRRALPIRKEKMDWGRVWGYKLGNELGGGVSGKQ